MTLQIDIPTPPARSREQKLEALEQANRVRVSRAYLKRVVKARPTDALLVIANPTPDFRTMHLRDLLLALPHIGQAKVDGWMLRAHISPVKTIDGLSDRQRTAAIGYVRDAFGDGADR